MSNISIRTLLDRSPRRRRARKSSQSDFGHCGGIRSRGMLVIRLYKDTTCSQTLSRRYLRLNTCSALGIAFVPVDLFQSRLSLFIQLVETSQLFQELVFIESSEQHGETVLLVRIHNLYKTKRKNLSKTTLIRPEGK
jgi:hypothetical protein